MSDIEKRKTRHIRISLEENVQTNVSTGFEDVKLIHRALPEIDLDDVDTSTELFGRKLKAPLIISAITGGTQYAKKINETLATAAEETGIGIGVGSQRIAVEQPEVQDTFSIVRECAPNALVLGNMGCPQISLGWGVQEAEACIDMIQADALAIHMNPLQEAVQVGGDTNYSGVISRVSEIASNIDTPIIMKETGCGIAYEEAVKLEKAGVAGLEVSGVGGTSWAAVEHFIAKEEGVADQEYLGKALWDWGIPTAVSVVETSKSTSLKIIASGGVRTELDIAKSLVLGADSAGIAHPFLEKAVEGVDAVKKLIENTVLELKTVMFLTGARTVEALKGKPAVIRGETAEWLRMRGFDPEDYSYR